MPAATTPVTSTTPSLVGSWISNVGGEKVSLTFLNNGTYLLGNRELNGSGVLIKAGLEMATYSWNASTGALTSATLTTTGGVGIPKVGANIVTIQSNGDLKLVVGQDGQITTFKPVLTAANSIVGAWYTDAKDGGSDDIVVSFLADNTFVVVDKGTQSRDPNGTSGVEYGTYTWNPTTGATTYVIQVNTDGQWGFSHGGPSKLVVSGNSLITSGVDGIATSTGPAFIRVSNLQTPAPVVTVFTGTAGPDTLTGGATNDTLTGLGGNDILDGGAGIDTAVYSSARSNFTIVKTATGYTVTDKTGAEGTDTLINIERLKFTDASVALDMSGNAGTTAKVLGAVFGKTSLTNKEYVGIGLNLLDGGMSYPNLMQAAINAKLGVNASSTAVVNLLMTNLTGSAPSTADLALYKGLLDSGQHTAASLGVIASDHALNTANINLVGLANTGIDYLPQG